MIKIRKAQKDDLHLINEMARVVFPATYREILSPQQLEYMMEWMYSPSNLLKQVEQQQHVYYIAFSDETPCGYVSVQPEGDDLFHLQKIYVMPSFQKKGIGDMLFDRVVEHIKEVHPAPCEMHLNVNRNNPALGFYKRKGMVKVSEGDFEIGNGFYMNDFIMGLEIK